MSAIPPKKENAMTSGKGKSCHMHASRSAAASAASDRALQLCHCSCLLQDMRVGMPATQGPRGAKPGCHAEPKTQLILEDTRESEIGNKGSWHRCMISQDLNLHLFRSAACPPGLADELNTKNKEANNSTRIETAQQTWSTATSTALKLLLFRKGLKISGVEHPK